MECEINLCLNKMNECQARAYVRQYLLKVL